MNYQVSPAHGYRFKDGSTSVVFDEKQLREYAVSLTQHPDDPAKEGMDGKTFRQLCMTEPIFRVVDMLRNNGNVTYISSKKDHD